jgi:hypothetical protein
VVEIIKKTATSTHQDAVSNRYSDYDEFQEDAEAENSGE